MLELAFLIGAYAYTVFLMGIMGVLYKQIVIIFALFYFVVGIYFFFKNKVLKSNLKEFSNFSKLLILIILIEAVVNFIGVLGPEISFDALWYHLTLPKIFLQSHKIFHIPGGVLYYSDFPKNIEMLYVFALSVGNEITAKFIHFLFGLGSILALYKFSRKFFTQNLSLLSVLIFYSSLVIGWQSITAYVDLGTTFFSILAVTEFINWKDKKNIKHLLTFSILVGLSISTKIVALISIPIFILLIIVSGNKNTQATIKNIIYFLFVSTLISLPWFLFSYINTGNPFFPIFAKGFSYPYDFNLLSILKNIIFPSDPINPIYLIALPLVFINFKKFNENLRYLFLYMFCFLLCWVFLAPIGGSRLVVPYLPVFSILVVACIFYSKSKFLKKYLILLILFISILSIGYRFLANSKYIPVILGLETKESFLSKNLNFGYGDFYDTDGFFRSTIKSTDKVLTFGFHNLYYVDFPYVDSTYVKKGDKFNFIATQMSNLPKRFSDFKQIHYNKKTGVKVYSSGGQMWEY